MKKISKRIFYSSLFTLIGFVCMFLSSCKKEDVVAQLPVIKSLEVTFITSTTSVCGGQIISDGGASIVQRGMNWSDNIDSLKRGKSLGDYENYFDSKDTFIFSMAGLIPGKTYYVRSYVKNSIGVAYSNINTFTTQSNINENMIFNPNLTYGSVSDIDGNIYKTITIGTQTWMAENLRTKHYRNGIEISRYRINKYDSIYSKSYGLFYNSQTKGSIDFAPKGWHVPSTDDWNILIKYLIENSYNYDLTLSGNKVAKSLAARTEWAYDQAIGNVGNNILANNKSGFSALPCGSNYENWGLTSFGYNALWWTNDSRFCFIMAYNVGSISQIVDGSDKYFYNVRCIKD